MRLVRIAFLCLCRNYPTRVLLDNTFYAFVESFFEHAKGGMGMEFKTLKFPKRMGRPTKAPKSGERVSLGLRVTADIKRKLDAAAVASGRSQSQEAELRLERSFERDEFRREAEALFEKMFVAAKKHGIDVVREQGSSVSKSSEGVKSVGTGPRKHRRAKQA